MNEAMKCAKCGGTTEKIISRKYSLLDLAGVSIVGSFIFGFLGLLLFSGNFGKGMAFLLWVGGLVAFGLYHLVSYNKKEKWKCSRCESSNVSVKK
jgi:hypothetical protein